MDVTFIGGQNSRARYRIRDFSRNGKKGFKKNELKPHLRQQYVIPPEQNADFVAHMEDILDIYHQPYDSRYPVICMDEKPVQLVKETRITLPAKPGHPEAFDYEYERFGNC